MSFRTFAILIAALATAPTAFAAKWEKVAETAAVALYADKETLRRSGGEVRSWVEWRWIRPTDMPDGSRQYRLERQVQISNCEQRSFAVVEGTFYADERGVDPITSYKYDEATLPWNRPPSRAIRDNLITWMCQASPAKK